MTLSFGPGPHSVRLTEQMNGDVAREPWCCEGVASGFACTPDCACGGQMLRHFQQPCSARDETSDG